MFIRKKNKSLSFCKKVKTNNTLRFLIGLKSKENGWILYNHWKIITKYIKRYSLLSNKLKFIFYKGRKRLLFIKPKETRMGKGKSIHEDLNNLNNKYSFDIYFSKIFLEFYYTKSVFKTFLSLLKLKKILNIKTKIVISNFNPFSCDFLINNYKYNIIKNSLFLKNILKFDTYTQKYFYFCPILLAVSGNSVSIAGLTGGGMYNNLKKKIYK